MRKLVPLTILALLCFSCDPKEPETIEIETKAQEDSTLVAPADTTEGEWITIICPIDTLKGEGSWINDIREVRDGEW